MVAGIVLRPEHASGLAVVEDPHELEVLAALGLILLLFHLGLEFSLDDLAPGGRRLVLIGAVSPAPLNIGGARVRLALGWGRAGLRDRQRRRHLVVGHRDQAAHRLHRL